MFGKGKRERQAQQARNESVVTLVERLYNTTVIGDAMVERVDSEAEAELVRITIIYVTENIIKELGETTEELEQYLLRLILKECMSLIQELEDRGFGFGE